MKKLILIISLVLVSMVTYAQSFKDKLVNEAVVYYIQVEYDLELSENEVDLLKKATLPLVVIYLEGRKINKKTSKEIKNLGQDLSRFNKNLKIDSTIDNILSKIEELSQ